MLTIDARAPGRHQPLIPQWHIPLPPEPVGRSEPLTLRALISRVVAAEVDAFRERRDDRRLLHVLTTKDIADGVACGRIDSGGRNLDQEVDTVQAIATALKAFEDGLYVVLIDGREQRDLDEQVFPGPDSHMTFLRLVMLSGG